MTVVTERCCERCGQPVAGRADKRFCTDACRNAANRGASRSDPARSAAPDNRLATITAIRADAVWDPPSEPVTARQTAEPCPHCGAMLWAEPCGTWLACAACRCPVAPAAIAAPYNRTGPGHERRVVSQRERDLEARELAARKAVVKANLTQLLADDRLRPDSRGIMEWYVAEVGQARDMARLEDLIEQYRGERIQRQHFWHGQPAAAIEAAGWDDDEDQDGDPEAGRPVLTVVRDAEPQAGTWDGAMALLGWRLSAVIGGCQVTDRDGLCGRETSHPLPGGRAWICAGHREQLADVITGRTG